MNTSVNEMNTAMAQAFLQAAQNLSPVETPAAAPAPEESGELGRGQTRAIAQVDELPIQDTAPVVEENAPAEADEVPQSQPSVAAADAPPESRPSRPVLPLIPRGFMKDLVRSLNDRNGLAGVEGRDFIQVDVRAPSELGRFLSLTWDRPFSLPQLGQFRSLSGLWHFLASGDPVWRNHSHLREVRQRYSGAPITDLSDTLLLLGVAMANRIASDPKMLEAFVRSTAPLAFFYTFGEGQVRQAHSWAPVMESMLDNIRDVLRDPYLQEPIGAQYRLQSIVDDYIESRRETTHQNRRRR